MHDCPGYERLIRSLGWPDLPSWQQHCTSRQGLAHALWPPGVEERWISGLALPLLNRLERAAASGDRQLIGLSALPGCGKSTLGSWIEAAAAEVQVSVAVVSLDDFYWPGDAMEARMQGNPWNAPRALPGSHDLELLHESLDRWQASGTLQVPRFERALRDGMGDRADWRDRQADVVLLEGWFLGVDPWTAQQEVDDAAIHRASSLEPTAEELAYRPVVCAALHHYTPLWDRLRCLWHLQAPSTAATVRWKEQQDALMQRRTGVGMEATLFDQFVRMLQLAILPSALQAIPRAEVVVRLDGIRRIEGADVREPASSQVLV